MLAVAFLIVKSFLFNTTTIWTLSLEKGQVML